MNNQKTEKNNVKNESIQFDDIKNVLKNYGSKINTNDLSVILSERYNKPFNDKKIRTLFRKNEKFNGIKKSNYQSYQFENPSKTIIEIINRFDDIEIESIERFKNSERKKSERKIKKSVVIELNDKNDFIERTVKPETIITGTDKK
jgi:hypothetical protein